MIERVARDELWSNAEPLTASGSISAIAVHARGMRSSLDFIGWQHAEHAFALIQARLADVIPAASIVRRYEDDSAAVIVPTDSAEADDRLLRRIRTVLNAPYELAGVMIDLGVLAISIPDITSDDDLTHRLNLASRSLRRGRPIPASIHRTDTPRLDAATVLGSLEDMITVRYQPIVELRTGRTVAVEALARLISIHGELGPREFIPLLGSLNLLGRLDRRVTEQALQDIGAIRSSGHDLRLAVNASQRALAGAGYGDFVVETCAASGVGPSNLTVEVSERDLSDASQVFHSNLRVLRRHGVATSIDDFGTGHSTYLRIRDVPADEVKIDRTFVAGMLANTIDTAIVSSVISLCLSLGRSTVAEGIEDRDTVDRLRSMGCSHGQGFLFARPLTLDELLSTLGPT